MDDSAACKELMRVNRTLRTLSAGNRTLLGATDEMELLKTMCRVVVNTGAYQMAFVGYAFDDPEKSVIHVAAAGADPEFLKVLPRTWADNEFGQTAIATAIRTGRPSVARNILTESAFAALPNLREMVRISGCSAVTALPLYVEGKTIGALTVLATEPEAFSQAEIDVLAELGRDLSFGISTLRTRARHREAETVIKRLAFYDPVTGLPNRALLLQRLNDMLDGAGAAKTQVCVLYLEVERFVEFIRILGFSCGDQLLLELIHRINVILPSGAILARVGEAEFCVAMPGAAPEAIVQARQLIALPEEPFAIADAVIDVRVGVGIAIFPGHGSDAATLIRRAAAALHQSSRAYGGYALHTNRFEQDSQRRIKLMGELHRAVRQNELQLYCQPKMDIASRAISGGEALIRWQHPEQGMIPPVEFIPFAEQAGTITPLTNWILDAAFKQSYAWQQAGFQLPIAVNLSAHDLYNPKLVDRVKDLFSRWRIPPEMIQFELTESALMAEPNTALETICRLKDIGIELFVDDFGTGYSGLSYLQRLPVDGIKIDQSFVMPMMNNSDSAVIVSSTIDLGHNLKLKVVAEGVESESILKRLDELGCDVAQGFLIAEPMPVADVLDWKRSL